MEEEFSENAYAGKGDFKDEPQLAVKPPKGLEVIESPSRLILTKKWKNPMGYILVVFSLFWTAGAMTFMFSSLFSLDGMWLFAIPFLVMPLLFVGVGLLMFYVGLQFIYNKSTVRVEDGQVFIETSPFARQAQKSLYKHEIQQVFVKKIDMNHQDSRMNRASPSPPTYSIYYIDQHGKTQPFFIGFKFIPVAFPLFTAKEGKYFEHKIEDFLKIENVDIKTYKTNQEALKTSTYNEQGEEIGFKEETAQTVDAMPIPTSLEVEESTEGLFIFRAWKSPMAILLMTFGLIWTSIVAPMAFIVFASLGELGAASILVVLFLIPFLGIGLGIIYTGIATWVNSTTVHLDQDYLRVSHHPLPWKGGIKIPTREIENIEVRKETRRGKNGSYTVNILSLRQKGKSELVNINYGNINPIDEECLFIEYKLKGFLNR